jgi:hypothetical protein
LNLGTLTIAAGWNSFDVLLNTSNFLESTSISNEFVLYSCGNNGLFRQFYFYKSTVVVTPTEPTVAAPTPTTAGNVFYV